MSKDSSDGTTVIGLGLVAAALYFGVQHNEKVRPDRPAADSASGAGTRCLNPAQLRNARVIIREGRRAGVGERGQRVAIAAAMQESKMLALPYGDRDSLGIFQQRAPWGSRAKRMNVATSARMFYQGSPSGHPGLTDKSAWKTQTITQAAQSVQQSAYPDRYGKWSGLAKRVVANPARTACK